MRENLSRETIRDMRLIALCLLVVACRRPLKPGETRCYSSPAGNSYITQCKTGQAVPVAEPPPYHPAYQQPPARRIIEGSEPIYCVAMPSDPTIGSCFFDRDKCNRIRANMTVPASECTAEVTAACFNFTWTLTGNTDLSCSTSVANCEDRLRNARTDPDQQTSTTQCDVYRMRKQ